LRAISFSAAIIAAFSASTTTAQAPVQARSDVTQPQLVYVGSENYAVGQQPFVRYRFDVTNKTRFSDSLFVSAPTLPPCGKNTSASRTWVDFYTEGGERLYGFCALQRAADLGTLWFGLPAEQAPPARVYLEMHDRYGNYTYRSALTAIDGKLRAAAPPAAPSPLVLDRVYMLGRWSMPGQSCNQWIQFEADNGFTTWKGGDGPWAFGLAHTDEITARDIRTGEVVLTGFVSVVDARTMTINGQALRRCG
jgi:hypothetical protein